MKRSDLLSICIFITTLVVPLTAIAVHRSSWLSLHRRNISPDHWIRDLGRLEAKLLLVARAPPRLRGKQAGNGRLEDRRKSPSSSDSDRNRGPQSGAGTKRTAPTLSQQQPAAKKNQKSSSGSRAGSAQIGGRVAGTSNSAFQETGTGRVQNPSSNHPPIFNPAHGLEHPIARQNAGRATGQAPVGSLTVSGATAREKAAAATLATIARVEASRYGPSAVEKLRARTRVGDSSRGRGNAAGRGDNRGRMGAMERIRGDARGVRNSGRMTGETRGRVSNASAGPAREEAVRQVKDAVNSRGKGQGRVIDGARGGSTSLPASQNQFSAYSELVRQPPSTNVPRPRNPAAPEMPSKEIPQRRIVTGQPHLMPNHRHDRLFPWPGE